MSAPLPKIIQHLGEAIAQAQHAMDESSIDIALQMATRTFDIAGRQVTLLDLGFKPTFYTFTEATVEAKLAFTVKESTEFTIGGELTAGYAPFFAISINAEYTRKYQFEANGSSSVAARLVSVPPPEGLEDLLRELRSS